MAFKTGTGSICIKDHGADPSGNYSKAHRK